MKILWIWGWTIQWKTYPLCLESYEGAAAKLASGPIKTKISASSVSVLQAAFKKKEMHEILTPTLINARLQGPCYSSWLCSAQPQFRKTSEHTSLVSPRLKWSKNPPRHADGRCPPRGGSWPSFAFQSLLQEINNRGGHPFASPLGKTAADQPVFLFEWEQSPSNPSQPFPLPSSPGHRADQAGAVMGKLNLPNFWQLHWRRGGGGGREAFVLKKFALFFQATSGDLKRKKEKNKRMYCVSPYKLSCQSLLTSTSTGPLPLDVRAIFISQDQNYHLYSISTHPEPGNSD